MDFRILGPLEIVDGDLVLGLPGGRGRALLALLILHPGEVIATERLIDELWGETSPPTAVKALQGRVSDLRKRLESDRDEGKAPSLLRTASPGYVLDINPSLVDANRFRQLVAEAGESPASERSTKLRQALRLWRGPALADFVYEPFAQREITALEELRAAATEMRVEVDLELGLHDDLIAELEALVAEYPFRERLRAQLILALYRAGRQADALAAYANTRRALAEELGVEPGPMLRELEKAILHQDPSLDRERSPERDVTLLEFSDVAKSWLPAERRTLTVIFVDVSLTGHDGADPEAVRRVVARASDVAAGVLRRHGATIEELVGQVMMGVFGIPAAHEDDVLRAARAAAELPAALAPLSLELQRDQRFRLAIRAGMESGEVVVGPSDSSRARVSGNAVNVAADLQRAARHGEVLVGDAAHRILREAALLESVEGSPFERAGGSSPSWRLIDVVPGASALPRRLDAPMVGRTAELARLQDSCQRAVAHRLAYRFTVLGDAGIGKSRLAAEFAETLGPSARVLTGHCPAYGEGITFRPLREVVLQAAGAGRPEALAEVLVEEDEGAWIVTQVAGALGLTQEPVGGEELFPAFLRFFEILSNRGPLVIILEDVHWAEPTLLDLIDHVTGRARGPVFLLCLARPELVEERPTWGAGGRSSDTLFLEPLDATETDKLIADRMRGGTLPPETLARIIETAQGNPLFAEQIVAAFQDEGTVMVPASADALLAARLDRLGPAERDLLRCAAVAGAEFAVDALMKLVPEQARPFVDRHLQALQRKQLIRPVAGQAFSFRHVLIQRAAYRSMTRQDRAKLHQRFADWLQSKEAEAPPEFDETLGYHLEQAVEQQRALGGADEQDLALAVRAGVHLANAATRAFARFDIWATENLSSRAKSLLPPAHPRRREVMRVLAETYPMMGRHDDADAVLAEMLEEGRAEGNHSLKQAIRLERARIRLLIGPDPTSLNAIRQEAERALEVFGESGDDARTASACYVLGLVHERMGNTREMEAISRRGLDHAKRSGRRREEAGPLWNLAWAVRAGATPVPDAIRKCEELAQWRGTLHPGVLCELAHLRAMAGEFDEARELISRARRLMVERMRMRRPLMWAARSSAAVEMLLGDSASGERELRAGLEMAVSFDERDVVSRIAARLSRSLFTRGETQEAGQFATLSYDYAPAESVAAQALWRVAKAWTASRDDPREAERLAREAVRLAPVEMPNLRADLHLELAEMLRARGDTKAAMRLIAAAIQFYERKGNDVSAARARSLAE